MMTRRLIYICALALAAVQATPSAQTYAPWVTMRITTPDGDTLERTARDSSVTTVTLKDGTVYELRPTIHDEPFSKVTIAIFKAATTAEPTVSIGEVQVTKGAAPVEARTKPNFKIAVPKIDALSPARVS
jgi:hypothetical protein